MSRRPVDPSRPSSALAQSGHVRIYNYSSSLGSWVAPERPSRREGPYPERLPELFQEHGLEAVVYNNARFNQMGVHALCIYDDEIRPWCPDVVVLCIGSGEAFPFIVPVKLHTYLTSWHVHPSFKRWSFRARLRKILWPTLRWLQTKVAQLSDHSLFRVSPKRLAAEVGKVVRDIRGDLQATVILIGVPPTNARVERRVPGMSRRMQLMDEALRSVVAERIARGDDRTHYLATSDLFEYNDVEELVPDGLHFSARAHEAIARRITETVVNDITSHLL